jgi:hypothetical protein
MERTAKPIPKGSQRVKVQEQPGGEFAEDAWDSSRNLSSENIFRTYSKFRMSFATAAKNERIKTLPVLDYSARVPCPENFFHREAGSYERKKVRQVPAKAETNAKQPI